MATTRKHPPTGKKRKSDRSAFGDEDPPGRILAPDTVAIAQGAFYVATGLWSLVDIDSFQNVTSPKTDTWLVKTVGALVTAVGGALIAAGVRKKTTPELAAVGAGCAAALGAVDVTYVAKGTISPVYLLDAVAEAGLLAGWGHAMRGREIEWPEYDRDQGRKVLRLHRRRQPSATGAAR